MTPFLIGLSGISGAGKSTLVEHLERQGGIKRFRFDAYYKDEFECPKIGERAHWDLPESLHLDQAYEALCELKQGNEIWLPLYSRKENKRVGRTIYDPAPIIFVEGLMLFSDKFPRKKHCAVAYFVSRIMMLNITGESRRLLPENFPCHIVPRRTR